MRLRADRVPLRLPPRWLACSTCSCFSVAACTHLASTGSTGLCTPGLLSPGRCGGVVPGLCQHHQARRHGDAGTDDQGRGQGIVVAACLLWVQAPADCAGQQVQVCTSLRVHVVSNRDSSHSLLSPATPLPPSPQKRSMIIRDDSGRSIELTLWGASATGAPGDQIMAVRRWAPGWGRWGGVHVWASPLWGLGLRAGGQEAHVFMCACSIAVIVASAPTRPAPPPLFLHPRCLPAGRTPCWPSRTRGWATSTARRCPQVRTAACGCCGSEMPGCRGVGLFGKWVAVGRARIVTSVTQPGLPRLPPSAACS